MIVVVASSYDDNAKTIVAHWGSRCATLLAAEDLCRPGWSFSVPPASTDTAVIGGKIVPTADIAGILTLRPYIYPQELYNIVAADRSYVAAELNAFLLAWLNQRSCPVVNRPGPACLAGPNWRPEQWTKAAARLGIPVRSHSRHVPLQDFKSEEEETAHITLVGECCFGDANMTLRAWTRQLAAASGTELLFATYSLADGCFVSATAWPLLADAEILSALKDRLEGKI